MAYPKGAKPLHLLSWSHFVELLKLDHPLERSFYEKQAIHDKWSVPELQRQMKSSLFLRLAAGKDKDAVLQLAQQGQFVSQPSDLLRDPFVFEFLKIPEPHSVSETDLETRLCDHLQSFLLELRARDSSLWGVRTGCSSITPRSTWIWFSTTGSCGVLC
jgi:predicted nuclease of restriction endonuclease-like (RecB) superfamily